MLYFISIIFPIYNKVIVTIPFSIGTTFIVWKPFFLRCQCIFFRSSRKINIRIIHFIPHSQKKVILSCLQSNFRVRVILDCFGISKDIKQAITDPICYWASFYFVKQILICFIKIITLPVLYSLNYLIPLDSHSTHKI